MLRPSQTRSARTLRPPSRVTMMFAVPALAAAAALLAIGETRASFLTNGNFATNGGSGQLTVNTTLAGWTAGGTEGNHSPTPPVFVFAPGTTSQLSTVGATGDVFMGTIRFTNATAAPNGGVIVAANGDSTFAGSIAQTVTGLTPGNSYNLTFDWAGGQQQNFNGPTTERWRVEFGASTLFTPMVSIPDQGFSGWQTASMIFTATSASQLLRFTADGTPNGLPPWLLINGVALNDANAPIATPEPSSMLVFGVGSIAVFVGGLRRRRAALAAMGA